MTQNSNIKTFEKTLTLTYFIYPQWSTAFVAIGGIILIVIGLLIRFTIGLSSASDEVFAIEAFISCIIADQFFKKVFRRNLVIGPMLKVPVIYLYSVFSLYIFFFRPFE